MSKDPAFFLLLLGFVLIIFILKYRLLGSVIIYDYQKGFLYRKGYFVKTLETGKYFYYVPNSRIEVIDMRKTLVTLPAQQILTKDSVNIKVTLVAFYTIVDPIRTRQSQSYYNDFYNMCQLILRDVVSLISLDELLEKKSSIDQHLLALIAEPAADLGLSVSQLAIKDIVLPANLKKAFSGIVEAQKEAQRQLEKARGEQAVLRKLANSSGMYENNPALLQARLVQALSTGNNTIVFTADDRLFVKASAGGSRLSEKQV